MAQGDRAQGAQKSAFWTHSLRDSAARLALDLSQREGLGLAGGLTMSRRSQSSLQLPARPFPPTLQLPPVSGRDETRGGDAGTCGNAGSGWSH